MQEGASSFLGNPQRRRVGRKVASRVPASRFADAKGPGCKAGAFGCRVPQSAAFGDAGRGNPLPRQSASTACRPQSREPSARFPVCRGLRMENPPNPPLSGMPEGASAFLRNPQRRCARRKVAGRVPASRFADARRPRPSDGKSPQPAAFGDAGRGKLLPQESTAAACRPQSREPSARFPVCRRKKAPAARPGPQLVEKPAVAIKPEQVLCVQARPKKGKISK